MWCHGAAFFFQATRRAVQSRPGRSAGSRRGRPPSPHPLSSYSPSFRVAWALRQSALRLLRLVTERQPRRSGSPQVLLRSPPTNGSHLRRTPALGSARRVSVPRPAPFENSNHNRPSWRAHNAPLRHSKPQKLSVVETPRPSLGPARPSVLSGVLDTQSHK
jgi:hypothetical protein